VITLKSGLQYKVLHKGHGNDHPTINSPCECHYEANLIDGTQFASTYSSTTFDGGFPITFGPNRVIKGWTEAMLLMVEGDKWELFIPSELGFGDSGNPAKKVKGGEVLICTLELVKIKGDKVSKSNKHRVLKERLRPKELSMETQSDNEKPPESCSDNEKPASKCNPKTLKFCSVKEVSLIKMHLENKKMGRVTKNDDELFATKCDPRTFQFCSDQEIHLMYQD